MEFTEKARVRIAHWLEHNEHHDEEYEAFSMQLDAEGKPESARHMREMLQWSRKANDALRKALEALGD